MLLNLFGFLLLKRNKKPHKSLLKKEQLFTSQTNNAIRANIHLVLTVDSGNMILILVKTYRTIQHRVSLNVNYGI